MRYCINPECPSRQNPDDALTCQTCGTSLVVQDRYVVLSPLIPNDRRRPNDLYDVKDRDDTRKVLKVLKWQEPKYIELFEREALTLQDLNCRGIPKAYGLFQFFTAQNEVLYGFVMDKIPGQNLAEWIRDRRRPSEKFVLNCLRQLIRILAYLHRSGYIHRDVKPTNVIHTPEGELFLIDFGSVQAAGHSQTQIISDGYTAPEQIAQEAIPESDIYALGQTIIHLATGIHPNKLKCDRQSGKLYWHSKAKQLSLPVRSIVDQLTTKSVPQRLSNPTIIERKLQKKNLLVRKAILPQYLGLMALLFLIGFIYIVNWSTDMSEPIIEGLEEEAKEIIIREDLVAEDLEKAKQKLRLAVIVKNLGFKQESRLFHSLGIACYLQSDFNCALKNYNKSIRIGSSRDVVPISYYQIGVVYEDMQQFSEAISEYEKALEIKAKEDIHYIKIVNRYARLLIWYRKNPDKALLISKEALSSLAVIDTKQEGRGIALISKNIGWSLLEKNELNRAHSYLLQSIEADDSDATSYCLLAQVAEARNNRENALNWWQQCNRKDNKYNLPETRTWQQQASRYIQSQSHDI